MRKKSPDLVIAENMFSLDDLKIVNWLEKLEDNLNGKQVVERAVFDLGITGKQAYALKRLYRIRETDQLRELLTALKKVYLASSN